MKNQNSPQGTHNDRPIPWLLPRVYQENIGCIQEKFPVRPYVFPRHGPQNGDGKLLLRRLHRRWGNTINMDGLESNRLERGSTNVGRGGAPE